MEDVCVNLGRLFDENEWCLGFGGKFSLWGTVSSNGFAFFRTFPQTVGVVRDYSGSCERPPQ